jgi:gas vesicle protein
MSKDNLGSCLVFFLLGAATGAAVALLYAPQEGEATRRYLADKTGEVKDKASEAATTIANQAKEKYSTVAQQAKDTYTTVSTQAKTKLDDIQGKAQDLLSRGQQAANDGIDVAADKAHTAVNSTA